MSNAKRVIVTLSNTLVEELDEIAQKESSNRSELIRKATVFYLQEKKKRLTREMMQRGYMEMAKINLNIASEAFIAEGEAEDTLYKLVSGG